MERAFRIARLAAVDHSIGTNLPGWALVADVKNGADVLTALPGLPRDLRTTYVGFMVDTRLRRALVIDVTTSDAAEDMKTWGERHELLLTTFPGLPSVVVIMDGN